MITVNRNSSQETKMQKVLKSVRKFKNECVGAFNKPTLAEKKEALGKACENFFINVVRNVFERHYKKVITIVSIIAIAWPSAYAVVKDDFMLLRNIEYAITADFDIEATMKEKEDKFFESEKNVSRLEGQVEMYEAFCPVNTDKGNEL